MKKNRDLFAVNKTCNVRKILLTATFLLSTVITVMGSTKIHLVDNDTRELLILASILDKEGKVVALTGTDGEIPELSPKSFPVTLYIYRI